MLTCTHVASRGIPSTLGGPYREITSNYGRFAYFLDALRQKHITKLVDVMSFDDAMTSYEMSSHHTCIGHVTSYYKRLRMPWLGEIDSAQSPKTLEWLVSNTRRSRHVERISGQEPTTFNNNHCVSLG